MLILPTAPTQRKAWTRAAVLLIARNCHIVRVTLIVMEPPPPHLTIGTVSFSAIGLLAEMIVLHASETEFVETLRPDTEASKM